MPTRPEDLARAVAWTLELPFHQALGLGLVDPADPARGLAIEVGPFAANNVGILHGGITAALLDVAGYVATLPALEPGTKVVTVGASSSLLRSARTGDRVEFRGTLDRITRGSAFCTSAAYVIGDAGETLIATGQIVKAVVPG